ncbi:hypothetical protein [Sporosarcina koreensis]|uniref:5-methylcytosine-specific restriction enzyme subunit McrC n=1 Tax=Sporosarcina koreensis TaxID=334735 RepID=A0ABW0TX87_9BACL
MSLMTINDCWSSQDYEKVLESTSAKLWRFIQEHSSIVERDKIVENLTGLDFNQMNQLASIHLLLSKEVQELVEQTAPNIMRRLSKSSRQRTEVERGRIKGKVNWTRTILTQQTEKNPSLFVCIDRSPVFDLIENKVLLYCLRYVFQIGQRVIKREIEPSDSISDDYINDLKKWMKKVEDIHLKCKRLLKSPLLRDITELHGINMHQIEKTRKARGREYKSLADIAKLIYVQTNQPLEFLYEIFSKQLLRPLSRDTLYEVAVAFKIIEVFKMNGWKEKRFSLIGEGRKYLSSLQKGNSSINISYQHIPSHFVTGSSYKELMQESKLSTHHRRPDILLEWENDGNGRRYTIIEVKRSQNRGYLADGVYKVLGYLKDFEKPLQDSPDSVGLLVGWRIQGLQAPKDNKEVYTSDWDRLPTYLSLIEKNLQVFLSGQLPDQEPQV